MCRECGADGPLVDVVQEDPWSWSRAEFVDEDPIVVSESE
jgi:hypothetical protein